MSQFHFHPETYDEKVHAEVPSYELLQIEVAQATVGVAAADVLDLGCGTGETLRHVLAQHPRARAVGLDESDEMMAAAALALSDYQVTFVVADLRDELPTGPFDLVTSALAVHHLDGPGKAALFGRVAQVLRPGGRFVLGDLVIPTGDGRSVTPLTVDYDMPSTVEDQIGWLGEAGLVPTMAWSLDDLAVLSADRPLTTH